MYPLNLTRTPVDQREPVGFAVANDADEHQRLSGAGYLPAFVVVDADPAEADGAGHTVESVRAALDAAGVSYDKRWGLAKLVPLLPA